MDLFESGKRSRQQKRIPTSTEGFQAPPTHPHPPHPPSQIILQHHHQRLAGSLKLSLTRFFGVFVAERRSGRRGRQHPVTASLLGLQFNHPISPSHCTYRVKYTNYAHIPLIVSLLLSLQLVFRLWIPSSTKEPFTDSQKYGLRLSLSFNLRSPNAPDLVYSSSCSRQGTF